METEMCQCEIFETGFQKISFQANKNEIAVWRKAKTQKIIIIIGSANIRCHGDGVQ